MDEDKDLKSISLLKLQGEDESSGELFPHYPINGIHLNHQDCDDDEKNSYHSHTFQPVDYPLDCSKQHCLDMASVDFESLDLMDILNYSHLSNSESTQADKLRFMEEQQEKLNSNLIALSTHFAQVQLRLKQIVDAPPSEKEVLLKNLEEFAFSGIPEVSSEISGSLLLSNNVEDHEEKIKLQREKQKGLISNLKSQLEELEKYAYETGEAGLPQSLVLERQKLILDQLKGKLNLNIDHMDQLTVDDLKNHVDNAIGQGDQGQCTAILVCVPVSVLCTNVRTSRLPRTSQDSQDTDRTPTTSRM